MFFDENKKVCISEKEMKLNKIAKEKVECLWHATSSEVSKQKVHLKNASSGNVVILKNMIEVGTSGMFLSFLWCIIRKYLNLVITL